QTENTFAPPSFKILFVFQFLIHLKIKRQSSELILGRI
ncbi:hypothetical protein X975_21592, partial [Stegodyphus mimosarum]